MKPVKNGKNCSSTETNESMLRGLHEILLRAACSSPLI